MTSFSTEQNAIKCACDEIGVRVEFTTTNGGHRKATVHFAGHSRFVIFATSASDWRAHQNVMRDLHRALSWLGVPATQKAPRAIERARKHKQHIEIIRPDLTRALAPVRRSFRGQLKDWAHHHWGPQ